MNSVSWLLYLAGVSGNISALFGWCVVISLILGVIGVISALVGGQDTDYLYGDEHAEAVEAMRKLIRRSIALSAAGTAFFGLLMSLTPSKETVYAIAASEVGEDILQSETGTLATQALNAWLKKQIAQ